MNCESPKNVPRRGDKVETRGHSVRPDFSDGRATFCNNQNKTNQ